VLDGNEQNPRIKLFETFGATVAGAEGRRRRPRADRRHRGKGYVDASGGKLKLIGGRSAPRISASSSRRAPTSWRRSMRRSRR
jgi:hypothetical protein